MSRIEAVGGPVVINGRRLSLSRAVRAGGFVFLTGQIPMLDGKPMCHGTIEEQTHNCLAHIRDTLTECGCGLDDVVKSTIWLKERADFPAFNDVYSGYFHSVPPARSAIVADFLVDIKVEIECIAFAGD